MAKSTPIVVTINVVVSGDTATETYQGDLMSHIQDLQAAVEAVDTVTRSAVTLIESIADKLDQAIGDDAQVSQLAAEIRADAQTLAEAVAANTPAESPADDPIVDPDAGDGGSGEDPDVDGGQIIEPDAPVTDETDTPDTETGGLDEGSTPDTGSVDVPADEPDAPVEAPAVRDI